MTNLTQQALELCWEIEKFPASEHQTATVLKASALHQALLGEQREAQGAEPNGMVLVPRQWTSEMAHAGYMVHQHKDIACAECGAIYAAMIKEYCK